MMFYCLANEQENGGGNAKSQDRQQGNNQYAFHGGASFSISSCFHYQFISLIGQKQFGWRPIFLMGTAPHRLDPFLGEILFAPHVIKRYWVIIVSYVPKKQPAGRPAGCEMILMEKVTV
jgi:hypothetical protein